MESHQSLVGPMVIDAEFVREDYGSIIRKGDWDEDGTTLMPALTPEPD